MSRRLRLYIPGHLHEVTIRTLDERFFLRPSAQISAIVTGVIGRAMALYPGVRLHYFVAMSNHFNLYVSGDDGEELSAFVGFVHGNISQKVNHLTGRRGTIWSRGAEVIAVIDHGAMIERLCYLLAQGCKEGLVAAPSKWPGPSAYAGLVGDMSMVGIWHDRNGETQAGRFTRKLDRSKYLVKYPIRLTPIPPFGSLDAPTLRRRHMELVERVVAETRAINRTHKRRPVGAAGVLAMSTSSRPANPKRSPAPLCHASSAATRDAYRAMYKAYVAAYRCASAALRSGKPNVVFPPGSFPCRGSWTPFVSRAPTA